LLIAWFFPSTVCFSMIRDLRLSCYRAGEMITRTLSKRACRMANGRMDIKYGFFSPELDSSAPQPDQQIA
jgi:hypothetical protein